MGNKDAIRPYLESITFSDGTKVALPKDGVTAIVGSNNAGKSAALRDISMMTNASSKNVVTAIDLKREGSVDDLEAWLRYNAHFQTRDGQEFARRGETEIYLANALGWWEQKDLLNLVEFFRFYASAEERLSASRETQSIDAVREVPIHPLQRLDQRPELEERLSSICVQAFNQKLTLNRWAGSHLYLHVGEPPPDPGMTVPPFQFREDLKKLPILQGQGDGMRSFMGLFLHVTSLDYFFIVSGHQFLRSHGHENPGSWPSEIRSRGHENSGLTAIRSPD